MDKTTKNKMDKQKCNNSPTPKQHRKSNKKPKNRSYIMTILDSASKLQKFYRRMPTNMFERITNKFIADSQIKPKIVALDGSGFGSDHADKYYLIIGGYSVKYYCKCHIAVDVDSRMIIYSQAVKGLRHDTKFVIASIRSLKKYNVKYIIADKAYDSEPIRWCINEEIKSLDQIPLKPNFGHGWYRRLSKKIFKKEIYARKKQCGIVFTAIKRKFGWINRSKCIRLQNK